MVALVVVEREEGRNVGSVVGGEVIDEVISLQIHDAGAMAYVPNLSPVREPEASGSLPGGLNLATLRVTLRGAGVEPLDPVKWPIFD